MSPQLMSFMGPFLYSARLSTVILNAGQMMNLTIVLFYTAILLIITAILGLRSNNPDPTLVVKNMPWWLVASSFLGTSISSIAFLAIPSKGFFFDLSYALGGVIGAVFLGGLLSIVFFFYFLKKTRHASICVLLGNRFGRWAVVYASLSFIAYAILRMGVIICLVAEGLHLICGVDVLSVIVLTGLVVIFYTYMTGTEGVIWMDFFQTLLLSIAGLSSVLFLLYKLPYEWKILWPAIQTTPNFLEGVDKIQSNTVLLGLSILFFTTDGLSFCSKDQGIGQRYFVTRSQAYAKWGLFVGLMLSCCIFFFIGVLLCLLYGEPSMDMAGHMDNIFAYCIVQQFPDGLRGLIIVGVLAAAMSSINTGINSGSTILIYNLYEPFARAPANEEMRQSLLMMEILRTSSVCLGVAGTLAACCMHLNGTGLLELFWKTLGIIISGVLGLYMLMRVSKKANAKSAIIGLAAGFLLAIWMAFSSGKDFTWASQLHYMLTFPLSAFTTLFVGLVSSFFLKKTPMLILESGEVLLSARKEFVDLRKRARKNIFADSFRPKPFYRIYAAIGALVALLIVLEGGLLGLSRVDIYFVSTSAVLLATIATLPLVIRNSYHKAYTVFCLLCLGIALPFLGATGIFAHPENPVYGYFYWITLVALGSMVGWTMLGLVSMVATALAAEFAVYVYPIVGVPDDWVMISMGALSIFTYFAMDAAKENLIAERTLGGVYAAIEKIYVKVFDVSVELAQAKRALNFQDMDRLAKSAGDVKLMLSALMGATDVNPEETQMELSIRETLEHVLKRFKKDLQKVVVLRGDHDFKIVGTRDIFESIVGHLLDNALYYVENKQATKVICTLDALKKTFTISNDGPSIKAKDRPYIFDLGYTCNKESLGLGLAYCKKMMEGMGGSIQLISRSNDSWVRFRLYFPKYAALPPEARMFSIHDSEDIELKALL